jgi:hypothetical protein
MLPKGYSPELKAIIASMLVKDKNMRPTCENILGNKHIVLYLSKKFAGMSNVNIKDVAQVSHPLGTKKLIAKPEVYKAPKKDEYVPFAKDKYMPTSHKKDIYSPSIPRKTDCTAPKAELYPPSFPKKKYEAEYPASKDVIKEEDYIGLYKREEFTGVEKKGYNDYKYGVYNKNEPKYGVYRLNDKYPAYSNKSRYGIYQKKDPEDKYTTMADATKCREEFKPLEERYVPYGEGKNYEFGVKKEEKVPYDLDKLNKGKAYNDPKKEIDKYQLQVDEYNKFLEEVKTSKENKELTAKKEVSSNKEMTPTKKAKILDDLKDIEFEKLNIVDEYINKSKNIYNNSNYEDLINKESYEKYVKKYENLYDDSIFDDILDTYGNEGTLKVKDSSAREIKDNSPSHSLESQLSKTIGSLIS